MSLAAQTFLNPSLHFTLLWRCQGASRAAFQINPDLPGSLMKAQLCPTGTILVLIALQRLQTAAGIGRKTVQLILQLHDDQTAVERQRSNGDAGQGQEKTGILNAALI